MKKDSKIAIIGNIPISFDSHEKSFGSWISNFIYEIIQNTNIEVIYFFPSKKHCINKSNNLTLISFTKKRLNFFSEKNVDFFKRQFNTYQINFLHIFGTEYPHAYEAIKAFNNKGKIYVHLQGLLYYYKNYFFSNLNLLLILLDFFWIFSKSSLIRTYLSFKYRLKYEIKALKNCDYILGRTDWDKSILYELGISSDKYIFMPEIISSSFKKSSWKYSNIDQFSILISQANYPIKGFHIFLKALKIVKSYFPNLKVNVLGKSPISNTIFNFNIYSAIIKNEINKLRLENSINFIGRVSSEEVYSYMKLSNVIVIASEIENSPNSLGEAMTINMPIISTFTGGISSLVKDYSNILLYQPRDYNLLAIHIIKVFSTNFSNVSLNQCVPIQFDKNTVIETIKKIYE